MNRWSIVTGVTLQLIFASACASKLSNGGGSETGFLACSSDSQCGTGQSCVEAKCVDRSGQTALEAMAEHAGTCDDPMEFPTSMPSWWQAEWTPSQPPMPRAFCGFDRTSDRGVAPAVVARWIAPSDGEFFAEGYSRDMAAVFGATRQCATADGCAWLEATDVPDPPFDPADFPRGSLPFSMKAGDSLFLSFQYLDPNSAPPPEHGTVIATVQPY